MIPSSLSFNIEDICNSAEENFGILDLVNNDQLKQFDRIILAKIKDLECFNKKDNKFTHNLSQCKNLRYCFLCGFINKISQLKISFNKENLYCSNCLANIYNFDIDDFIHYINMNLTVCGNESINSTNQLTQITCPICKVITSIENLFEKLDNNDIEIGYNTDFVFLKVSFNLMKRVLSENTEGEIRNKLEKILCSILKRNEVCLHFSQYIDTEEPNILNFLILSHQEKYCLY